MIQDPYDDIVWYVHRRDDGTISLTVTISQDGVTDKTKTLLPENVSPSEIRMTALARTAALAGLMRGGTLSLEAKDELEF